MVSSLESGTKPEGPLPPKIFGSKKKRFFFLILGKEIKLSLLENIVVNLENQRLNLEKKSLSSFFWISSKKIFKEVQTRIQRFI